MSKHFITSDENSLARKTKNCKKIKKAALADDFFKNILT